MCNSGLRPERREPERDFRKFSLPMPANTWWSRSIIVVVAVCNDAAYLALIRKAPYRVAIGSGCVMLWLVRKRRMDGHRHIHA